MRKVERKQFSTAILKQKGQAVLDAMDPRATTDRFTYLRRHFWVTKDFSRGAQITPCICAKCVVLGPI